MAQAAAIIRRWQAGYRTDRIAIELRCSELEVIRTIHRTGVCYSTIAARNRREKVKR